MAVLAIPQNAAAIRRQCDRRRATLIAARQPWLDYCRLVADELMPSRLPYLLDPHGTQKGGEQNKHLVDSVGPKSVETSAAGIFSGTMPTSSRWFELAVRGEWSQDEQLLQFLEESGDRLLTMHNQSNAAQVLPECCKEWVAFGTGAALIIEDDEDVYRLDQLSVGEYCIAESSKGRVDTLYRDVTMTVGQLEQEFGLEALSPSSRAAWDDEEYDREVPCVHAIEPDRDRSNPDLPWRSVYYELNSPIDQLLAVRGFRRFPALVWRWTKLSGTAYGYGLGMDALPHLVRLRKMIYRYGQAVAFKTEPPLALPPGLAAHEVKALPGGKTKVFGQQPITTLFRVELELRELSEEIELTRQQVRDTLGATLVASLRQVRHQMTAREADLRTTQDLQEFLPGLTRQTEELLNPYIEWLWDLAEERGLLSQAPDVLQGQPIDIEYTSPLARKQKAGEVDAIVRTYAIAGEISKARPDILDNLNPDEAIRRIARIEGAPTATLIPIEQVRKLRAAREQQQAAQAQADAAQQGVDIARTAAEAGRIAEVA